MVNFTTGKCLKRAAVVFSAMVISSSSAVNVHGSGPLKEQSGQRNIMIGSAVFAFMLEEYSGTRYANTLRRQFGLMDDAVYAQERDVYKQHVATEFDIVTTVGAMKPWPIHPNPPGSVNEYDFTLSDYFINFAEANNMKTRGHTLVWHSTNGNPAWLRPDPNKPGQFLIPWSSPTDYDGWRQVLEDHIETVMTRYYGKVHAYDVVNEPIADDEFNSDNSINYRDCIWTDVLGSDYVPIALQKARETDPNTKLLINEGWVLIDNDPNDDHSGRADAFYQLAVELIRQGIPIDGVGFQSHIITNYRDFAVDDPATVSAKQKIIQNLQSFADLGLEIHITEMDIRLYKEPVDESRYAAIYANLMEAFLSVPNVKVINFWGFTDRYHTMVLSFPEQTPGLFDSDYNISDSHSSVYNILSDLLGFNTQL